MESEDMKREFGQIDYQIKNAESIRHLADREHDYIYVRSNYFILSQTILMTAFILAIKLNILLAYLIYSPIAFAGLIVSILWIMMGCQSQNSLEIVREMVVEYEDKLPGEMRVYKKFRKERRKCGRLGPSLDSILLRLIPGVFMLLWICMLAVSFTHTIAN